MHACEGGAGAGVIESVRLKFIQSMLFHRDTGVHGYRLVGKVMDIGWLVKWEE